MGLQQPYSFFHNKRHGTLSCIVYYDPQKMCQCMHHTPRQGLPVPIGRSKEASHQGEPNKKGKIERKTLLQSLSLCPKYQTFLFLQLFVYVYIIMYVYISLFPSFLVPRPRDSFKTKFT
jgi:hypothetical protein